MDMNTGIRGRVYDTNSGYSCWENYIEAMPLRER